jgi:hypothetical protein
MKQPIPSVAVAIRTSRFSKDAEKHTQAAYNYVNELARKLKREKKNGN